MYYTYHIYLPGGGESIYHIKIATENNYDTAIIDTAGRLQNRSELMDELAKIIRVIKK